MKPIKFFIVCILFCMQAIAQTPSPTVVFDPISVSTFYNFRSNYTVELGPVDHNGNVYFKDSYQISKVSPAGIVTRVAGTGVSGYADGPAATAQFNRIEGMVLDPAGNLYVSDANNNCVRKITAAGLVSTIAGNGEAGNLDGTGTAARLASPSGITVDPAGNVYVADAGNNIIRKITAAGVVTTIASNGVAGALFSDLRDMAIDSRGNLYVQQVYAQLQKIAANGQVSTIYPPGFSGFKSGIIIDKTDNLYVINWSGGAISSLVYKIFPGGDAVVLAGSTLGNKDSTGIYAQFGYLQNLSLDDTGNIYVSDANRIRKLSKPTLTLSGNAGVPSPAKYFAISGNYLSGSANLQAPPGYELSLNESGPYSTTLAVPATGGEIKVLNVYIRLTANLPVGTYNDSVVLSSSGAVTKKLGVSGTVSNSPRKLVIIGSATSSCLGVSPASDCYVSRLASFYNKVGPFDTTIDNTLARVNTNCYNGMPSSYVSPYSAASGYTPIKEINITAALALHPNAILVNYPSNGYDVLSVNEIMFCLRTIRDSANQQGIPCFITTTQPRTSPVPFNTSAMKLKLAILKDSILAAFGSYAIDFWTGLTNPADSSILYDQGDHINMNGAGHNILFQRVLGANVFSNLLLDFETGVGLQGAYHDYTSLPGTPPFTRTDATVNIDLADGISPAPGTISATNYAVRWSGQVKAQFSQTYTFYTLTDKGAVLTVNGVEIISDPSNTSGNASGPTERSGTITLVAGQKYTIQLDYSHETGKAVAKLLWSGARTPKAIVPQSQLFLPGPEPAPTIPACALNTAPVNGSAIATATTATLIWNAVAGATSYYVYLWTGPDPAPPVLPVTTTSGTSYTASGLTPSSLYKWFVLPLNGTFTATGCGTTNKTSFTTAASTTIGNGTGLQGVYYNGITLSGTPLLTRIDPTINFKFDWEQQPIVLSPAPGIVPEDFYSVRWTGFVQPLLSETYTFYTNSDDGIRLWVNNTLLIDSWIDQNGSITRTGSILLTAGQKYDIKIEFYEKTSASLTKLYWSSTSTPKAIVPQSQLFPPDASNPPPACAVNTSPANASTIASQTTATLVWNAVPTSTSYDVYIWSGASIPAAPTANTTSASYPATGLLTATTYNWFVVPKNAAGAAAGCGNTNKTSFTTAASTTTGGGTGLQGVYYNGIALAGTPLLTRIDPTINFKFDWEQQPIILSPAPGIVPEDFYSVRWTGFVQPLFSETYTFYTNSDDGIRLWVNNVLLIDSWIDQNGSITRSGTIALVAGQKYDIKIDFYEKASASLTKLYWSSASTPKAIVPQSQLFLPANGARMADIALQTKLLPDASAFAFTTANISPNPVKRGQPARLQINSHRAGAAVVSVLSSNGARISNQIINLVKGVNISSVNTNGLAQGLYLINITGGSKPLTVKLIVN